jgi:predicted phage terminase large subunit-like protein
VTTIDLGELEWTPDDITPFSSNDVPLIPTSSVYTYAGACYVNIDNTSQQVNPIVVIDPAFSTGKNGDDCAIVAGCKLADGRTVVFDAAVSRMEASEVVKTTLEFCNRFNTLRVFHEANGVGLLVPELFTNASALVNGKRVFITGHYEQRPKEAKIQGVLEVPFAVGNFVMTEAVWNNEYLKKQLKNYPAVRHDDYLDALVTLYEKALPNRYGKTAQKNTLQPTFGLTIDKMLETAKEPKKTTLGTYNAYFR